MKTDEHTQAMIPGTRMDIATTAIEYIGDFDWEEDLSEDADDPNLSAWKITLPNGRTIAMSECERTGGPMRSTRAVAAQWPAVVIVTDRTGYLVRITEDGDGAYVARFWTETTSSPTTDGIA